MIKIICYQSHNGTFLYHTKGYNVISEKNTKKTVKPTDYMQTLY